MFTQDDNQSQVSGGSSDIKTQADSQLADDVATTPPTQTTQNFADNTQIDQQPQINQNNQTDYVDSYTPPGQTAAQDQGDKASQDQLSSPPQSSSASAEDALKELEKLMKQAQEKKTDDQHSTKQATEMKSFDSQEDKQSLAADNTSVDSSTAPPKMTMPASAQMPSQSPSQAQVINSQELADQNIFFLLGAEDGSTEEQEQFLDELQQTVWDDFVSNDMASLITSEEKIKADEILNNSQLDEMNKQEELLNYLDGLVPDLEEVMLEKALKLKEDLVRERVASYKESFAQDQVKLQQLQDIEQLMTQNQWKTVGEKLNQIE